MRVGAGGRRRKNLEQLVPLAFDVVALLLFVVAVLLLVLNRKWAGGRAGTALLGAVACALMGHPERFETISFSVMRGSFEAKMHQLEVGLKELQQIATAAAKASLTELAMSGQMLSDLSTQGKFSLRNDVVASLKSIGVPEENILNAQQIWIGVFCNILLRDIIAEVGASSPNALTEIAALPRNPKYGLPEPTALEEWASSHSLSGDRTKELLDEYRRVWTTGSMKDPSIIPGNPQLEMLPHQ
jgi:hypothetical protein